MTDTQKATQLFNQIPASIKSRAFNFYKQGKGDMTKCLKLAFEAEQNFLMEMIDQKTERSRLATKILCDKTYNHFNA